MSSPDPFNVWRMSVYSKLPLAILPRKRLEISYNDYLYGIYSCTKTESEREYYEKRIEKRFEDGDGVHNALTTLSVRTGFDLLLRSLNLPKGSEVICSAVTIKDMIKIIQLHGLIPVPVDLMSDNLEMRTDLLKEAITPKTKLILVAHIFGSITPLDEVIEVAGNIPVIEDCAEAFVGPKYIGHPGSYAVAFSFGTIKTATALGGSVWTVRDEVVLNNMRELNNQMKPRTNMFFLKRLLKYMGVSILMAPHLWGIAIRLVQGLGFEWEPLVTAVSRGFPGPDLIGALRQRCSIPLLALMDRRFSQYNELAVNRRKALSDELVEILKPCPGITIPGLNAKYHSYWLFPVMINDKSPDLICNLMLKQGYDVTQGTTQLGSIDEYVINKTYAKKFDPSSAREMMKKIIYIPITTDMPREVMLKMAKVFMKTMNKVMGKNRRGGTSTKKPQGKQASSNSTTSSAAVEEDIAEDLWEEEEDFLIPNSRL